MHRSKGLHVLPPLNLHSLMSLRKGKLLVYSVSGLNLGVPILHH